MVERNWVVIETGVPKRLHIIEHLVTPRKIRDPHFDVEKEVEGLVLLVDRVDGEPVLRTWSVLSTRLWELLEPYFEGQRYKSYEFIVTKLGRGFLSEYKLEVLPHVPP